MTLFAQIVEIVINSSSKKTSQNSYIHETINFYLMFLYKDHIKNEKTCLDKYNIHHVYMQCPYPIYHLSLPCPKQKKLNHYFVLIDFIWSYNKLLS